MPIVPQSLCPRVVDASDRFATASVLFAVLALSGCSQELPRGTVTGVVTQNGKPLDSILINFMPDPTVPGGMSTAVTDDQGRYELEYMGEEKGKGAVVGLHRVILNDLAPENYRGDGTPPVPRVAPEWMDANKTPYRFEIKPGDQTIDLKLDP